MAGHCIPKGNIQEAGLMGCIILGQNYSESSLKAIVQGLVILGCIIQGQIILRIL